MLSIHEKIKDISSRLEDTMLSDRYAISKKITSYKSKHGKKLSNGMFKKQLLSLEKRVEKSVSRRLKRANKRPSISYPENLPIIKKKETIIDSIKKEQVVIISGDTGSGKSTQLPKMCLSAGRGIAGKIACTQPRRIAATTVSQRIAQELGEDLGKSVGYKIRFKDRSNPEGYIKIMTDGMLLAETQGDPSLYEYDTIIIDEAHERSLNIDFLMGLMKGLLKKRKELKLIITSATMDTRKFSDAFDEVPVIHVEGRSFPVEVQYMPPSSIDFDGNGEANYVDLAVKAVKDLEKRGKRGDILIFMPTEQDIRDTCDLLNSESYPGISVLPLFARLTAAQQKKVFGSFSGRKIIVATNVAETSITIPGIRYVIDTGLARIPKYLPRTRTTSLLVSGISKSSADQRKGRCGRMEKGTCIRLYSEEDYDLMPEYISPEILRSNLAEVILRMLSLNLGEISTFPFVDRPSPASIKDGFNLLLELGAITRKVNSFSLTKRGREMASIPLDPRISRILIEAQKEGCVNEVAIIASALSIQDPRERPLEKSSKADQMHAPFKDGNSDFFTLLNIWNKFYKTWDELKTQSRMRKFAKDNFLSFVRMREWKDIHDQILLILKEQNRGKDTFYPTERFGSSYDSIHRSILSGYLYNIAQKKEGNIYNAARGREVMLFPGSTLFGRGSTWIVASEIVKTSRLFARNAAKIDPEWLESLGGDLCKVSYSKPHWSKNRGGVLADEQVSLYGLIIVPKRVVSYGNIDPIESHEIFIRSALVEGEIKERFPFLIHNQHLLKKLSINEEKLRRRDLLVGDNEIAAFYSERLEGICDIRGLKRIIRRNGDDEFLKMKEKDLILSKPDDKMLARFPGHTKINGNRYSLSYKFSPGNEEDGVTISIPSSRASRFPAEHLEWVVPGLYREKITALLKGLPKRYRRQLVPVPEKVEIIVKEMRRSKQSLITALADFIYKRFGVDIPSSEWPIEEIPDHLKMRISIIDHKGDEIDSGRDIDLLAKKQKGRTQKKDYPEIWKRLREEWERSNIVSWDFPDLPGQILVNDHLTAYPRFEAADGSVNIRLFDNMEEALKKHRQGIKELFSIVLKKDIKFTKRVTKLPNDIAKNMIYFGDIRKYENEILSGYFENLFSLDMLTREEFFDHVEKIKTSINQDTSKFMEQVGIILQEYHMLRTRLHDLEASNRKNSAILGFIAALRRDLDGLVPYNFHGIYNEEILSSLPRYLRGMAIRADRGVNDLEKDRRKAEQQEFIKRLFQKTREGLSTYATREKIDAINGFRWAMEEFKISLFAPEIKTAFPVSRKRLEKRLKEIERMV